jgi:tetratricopeptide (TPR) repeat protein
VLYDLARAYQTAGALGQAERAFKDTLNIDEKHAIAHRDLGTLLFNRRKYQEAVTHYEAAGKAPGARTRLAVSYYMLNDYTRARKVADQAAGDGEASPELNLLLAQLDIADGEFEKALKRLSDPPPRSLMPHYSSALFSLATTAEKKNAEKAADDAFDLLLRYEPTAANYLDYGRKLMERAARKGFGAYATRAAGVFTQALERSVQEKQINPELATVRLELAEALLLAGEYRSAQSAAAEFLSRDMAAAPKSADPPSTERYVPVAKLIVAAAGYLDGSVKDPLLGLTRDLPDGLPYPALELGTSQYLVARWDFTPVEKFACTKLAPAQRGTVVALSQLVQKKVGQADGGREQAGQVNDVCKAF